MSLRIPSRAKLELSLDDYDIPREGAEPQPISELVLIPLSDAVYIDG